VGKRSDSILVIDDDPDFVKYVKTTLEHEGYTVLSASSGQEGIEAAIRCRPAVVVLDLLMTPEDGFTTCEELRSNPETRRAAIVVISAIGQKMHKKFGSLDVGARLDVDGFFEKPVEPEVLTRTVSDMLALAHSRRPAAKEEP